MGDTRVHVVDAAGAGEFTSITDAVRAAVDGDTVQVRMGKYDEVLIVDRNVTVANDPSAEPEDILVLGGAVVTGSASIAGLSFLQSVDVRAGSPRFSQCRFTSPGGDGIRICTGSSAHLDGCKFVGGTSSGDDGCYVQEGAKATVERCDFTQHRVNAVHCNGGEVHVRGCRITACAFGVFFRRSGQGSVSNCTIDGISRVGIYVTQSSDPAVTQNTVMNCTVSGIMVAQGALGNLKDNTVHGNVRILAGCSPTLGSNSINGRFDNENTSAGALSPNATFNTTAGSVASDRKQSVLR